MIIKDNNQQNKSVFNNISNLTNKILNKTLDELEKDGIFIFPENLKETEDLTEKQFVLYSENENYFTENIIGFIGYDDEQLIIKSRFDSENNNYFTKYLFNKVLNIPNFVNLNTDVFENNGTYNILIFLFAKYLKNAMRKGIFKKYVNYEYNDEKLKGTIDIKKHIILNTPFLGKIAYSNREYSLDNEVTELIHHTIIEIKKKKFGQKILSNIKEEVNTIFAITPNYKETDKKKIIIKNQKNIVRHSYYHEYRALQQLCLMILQNNKSNINLKKHHQLYGILFDISWLWEEYINTIINEQFYHPINKKRIDGQFLFANNSKKVYPDFIRKIDPQIIVDAKYKPIFNIHKSDYSQLLAYMFRFDSKKGYYIYPLNNPEIDVKTTLFLNKGTSYDIVTKREDITVIKYGIRIPFTNNYEDFVKQMIKYEEELKQEFN